MKKRLVFFIYVDTDYVNSRIYDVHFYLLKHFKYNFDEYTFWLSLKDFSEENIEFASEIVKKLMSFGFTKNTEYKIYENDFLREAKCFNEEVVTRVFGGDNELIFFGYTKGLSNEFNDSLLFWICSMYYFGLNFKNRIDDIFNDKNNHIAFYGFPLMDYNTWNIVKYNHMYAGTFYWINTEMVRKIKDFYNIDFSVIENRDYAENFTGDNFLPCFCGTYTGKRMPCWEMYHFSRNGMVNVFNENEGNCADLKEFCEFYNKMINDLNIFL